MKKFIAFFALATVCGLAHVSVAQSLTYDIATAQFKWQWTPGTNETGTSFRLYCGATTGVYTIMKDTGNVTSLSLPVSSVLTATGTYFCVVKAFASSTGLESKPSNEVNFRAVQAPTAPSAFQVQ